MYFTKIDNTYLESPNELTNAEFRVLMCIYRLTAGYQRNKYKIPYSQLTKMSGIKNVSIICHSLKLKGRINFEPESGKASVITILKPVKSVNGLQKKVINSVNDTHSVSEPHPLSDLTTSRGAKENYKENLKKDLFLEFQKKYPEDKFDDDVEAAWNSISYEHQQLIIGVMQYQLNKWDEPNFNRKYIPKASNYLLKQLYLDDAVKKPYEDKLWREREAIERREYLQAADKNSASDEEKKAILSNWKNH